MQAMSHATRYQGSYMMSEVPGLKDHGKHYPSSSYIDELAWGNLWLYFATGVSLFGLMSLKSPFGLRSLKSPV